MTHLGYTDAATQQAVIDVALKQEDSLVPVREAHRKLTMALLANPKADAANTAHFTALRAAIDESKQQQEKQVDDLEKRIEFSKKPGLAIFLSLMGITGDESAFMGGITGNFTGAMANMNRQLG